METISITMSQEENNMSVDEAVDGFLLWLIRDTKAALAWIREKIHD